MINRTKDQTIILNKSIYKAETTLGWSVVIMPDGILIDNYHQGYAHIHLDPYEYELIEKIKDHELLTVYKIVYEHIHENEGLKLKKLIKELRQ